MTNAQGIAFTMSDATFSGLLALLAVVAQRIHDGSARRRVVSAALVASVDAAGAAVLRIADGPTIPIWYIPVYAMIVPVATYAVFVHIGALLVKTRQLAQARALAVVRAAERAEAVTAASAAARAPRP